MGTEEFEAIVAGLELEEPDEDDVLRVDLLDNVQLVRRYQEVRRQLLESGEMLADLDTTKPSTSEGRRLHSERAALLIEMKRRNLR